MFQTHFYHQRLRKSVAVFGTLFNNIHVLRKDSGGQVISQVKVPLAYAPKQKYLERIRDNPTLEDDTKVAIKLPRMSFEIISMTYDPQRQLQKNNTFSQVGTSIANRAKFRAFVPYTVSFQLSIYAKSQDDALQIVEQILPYFNPQYTLTLKPFEAYPDVKEDVPITLVSVDFQDDYESAIESRRTIIYTLAFDMKVNFYGPVESDSKIIRTVKADIYHMGANLRDSDIALERIQVTPDPADADPEDDYGFNVAIIRLQDSA